MKLRLTLFFYYLYSFLFCIRYLCFRDAIKVPILIHPSVRIKGLGKGRIEIKDPIKRSMIIIGLDGALGRSNCKSLLYINKGAKLILHKNTTLAKGIRMVINKGVVEIGRDFYCNGDCSFFCNMSIKIGNGNLFGWNVHFNTTDGHSFYVNEEQTQMSASIIVRDHVWVGANSIISKGSDIASECVVAQCSLVNRKFNQKHCLIGGIPARVIKENIGWAEK